MNLNSTKIREIRKFGLVALVFFGMLCALGIWRQKPLPIVIFGLLTLTGVGFIFSPRRLSPVHAAWLKIAHFMGKVVTLFMLTIAYYLVMTPTAMIKRIFGGAPLPIRPDKEASSYWVDRDESAQPKERFSKRF